MSAIGLLDVPQSYWPAMSAERYAALERATGAKVVKAGDIWWQESRPFFYRPLLPFKKYDLTKVKERVDKIGIFQHGVEDGQSFNSYLNPIVFERSEDYEIRKLRDNVRGSLKKALRGPVIIRPIADEDEFSERGYPVYLSFYQRTRYGFDKSRRKKSGFARWAHTLFQFPEAAIFGAFVGQELVSFEITCLVENTLMLKTIVTSDVALKLSTPDLLLHYYRSTAFQWPEIHAIYDSLLARSAGLNKYKIMRGARVSVLPAFLHIHPSLLWLIKKANASVYGRLRGLGPDELIANHLANPKSRHG